MPKTKAKPKKRVKMQKQKQNVKQSVKVSVQSSGGSGGGGSSQGGAVPSYVPSAFNEARLANLVEQISLKVPVKQDVPVNTGMPIPAFVPPPALNPVNDKDTLKSVFQPPINFDKPMRVGGVSKGGEKPTLAELAAKFKIEPIDTRAMSDKEMEEIWATEFNQEQEFLIPKKGRGGRPKGSKNKPKGEGIGGTTMGGEEA